MRPIGAAIVAAERMNGKWPPVLTGLVVLVGIGAVIGVIVTFRTLREGVRAERLRPRGYRR